MSNFSYKKNILLFREMTSTFSLNVLYNALYRGNWLYRRTKARNLNDGPYLSLDSVPSPLPLKRLGYRERPWVTLRQIRAVARRFQFRTSLYRGGYYNRKRSIRVSSGKLCNRACLGHVAPDPPMSSCLPFPSHLSRFSIRAVDQMPRRCYVLKVQFYNVTLYNSIL